MYAKVIVSCCLLASVIGRPDDAPAAEGYGYETPEQPLSYKAPSHEKHEGMPFDFAYDVKDAYKGLDFGHESNSDGKVVTGKYYVLLPDGRTQIVTYTADHYNGYQAEVTYEGEAKYPEPEAYEPAPSYSAPKESYGAPAPTYEEPAPTYGTPAPTYEEPAPAYGAPAPTYEEPSPSYGTPAPTYEEPKSLYGAPEH